MVDAVLVTGATGGTGSALLELLVSRGVGVRAMVRREGDATRIAAMGVDTVVADFDDDAASAIALQGVDRVYVVTPSSERAEDQQRRFIELAAATGVQQVVKLSQLGADESSPVRFRRWHAAVERRVRELGVGYTFLRPNLFFQGLFAFAGTIGVTIDPVGSVAPKTGAATVTGTVTCSFPAEVFVDVSASQRAGRVNVQGFA
jgi:uncharacterized protein YbjT (DUF2867 family)